MTLDEAIKHAEEVAEQNEWFDKNCLESMQCRECAEEHRQLAEWLKELKWLKDQEPCKEAIDRQAVIDIVDSYSESQSNVEDVIQDIISDIVALSPANPQPKTGHWIDIMVGEMPAQACDQCNTFYSLAYTGGGHNYCPNCGAKMVDVPDINDGKLSEIPTEGSDKE